MSQTINYDYHGLKEAHGKLEAAVEAFKANTKTLQTTGQELVEGNNAEGVKATMTAFEEKQAAVVKIMDGLIEQSAQALANARELHIANGGEE